MLRNREGFSMSSSLELASVGVKQEQKVTHQIPMQHLEALPRREAPSRSTPWFSAPPRFAEGKNQNASTTISRCAMVKVFALFASDSLRPLRRELRRQALARRGGWGFDAKNAKGRTQRERKAWARRKRRFRLDPRVRGKKNNTPCHFVSLATSKTWAER